jgi:hypothetical protein
VNLIMNPTATTDANNWSSPNMTIARTGATGFFGSTSIGATAPSGTATSRTVYADTIAGSRPVVAGRRYWWSVYARGGSGATATTARLWLKWLDRDGNTVLNPVPGPAVALNNSTWVRLSRSATAPPGAVTVQPTILLDAAIAATSSYYFDGAMLNESTRQEPYFDGSTAPDSLYTYSWTGVVGASTSQRIATDPHPEEALIWRPGVSAWDFLQPIWQARALRLFCDEARRWYLVAGGYVAEGSLSLSVPGNLIRADEDLSRDAEDWFDAALVRYVWADSTGTGRERIDWYSAPSYSKVSAVEIRAPFPGAGLARYMVERAKTLGRVFTLRTVSQYTVRASQPVVATVPETPDQAGVVKRVEFDLTADEMTVTTRGLSSVVTGSWSAVDPATPWNAIPGDPAWNAWNPTI